ncbi:GNAT family N-acetyltransferase [Enterococcus olivae]
MEAITLSNEHKDIYKVKELYQKAFPKNERIPFWFLIHRTKQVNVECVAYYDQQEFVGFTYLIEHQKITYVFYLAICESARSKGYGSVILDAVKLRKNHRVVLCIEATDVPSKKKNSVKNARISI